MKVSKLWLDKFFDTPLPDAAVLADALTFHAFEIDGIEKKGDDEVLDVKVTPNRGHDALSHRGIAKEISAILKLPVTHDPFASTSGGRTSQSEGKTWPSGPERPSGGNATVTISIEDSKLCKRYIAAYIKGVKVGPSPKWLREHLEAIGQRSINNVVDATNFVMFNTGQPLHAFDAAKLLEKEETYSIEVRHAREGEKLMALDNKEYTLNESMLVIADANKNEAIGIAGVKGGMPAGITEETKDIIIESANFDSVCVRKTAAALKLRTDASARFEQGLSPELAAHGMENMLEFVAHMLGGEVVGITDVYPAPQEQSQVSVWLSHINEVLGTTLTGAEVADVFVRLGFSYKEEQNLFTVIVPQERLDLIIPEDLVEEVGRIIGYDKVPSVELPHSEIPVPVNTNFYWSEKVRQQLTAQGFSEVFTSVFTDKGEEVVLNKVDGVKPFLRATLTDGLNEALKKNIPNKDLLGLKEIKLFEIGTVWHGGKEEIMVGIVSEKQKAVEETLAEHIGKEVPSAYEDLGLSQTAKYKTFSKYPYIVRDVALWVPKNTDENKLRWDIAALAGPLCQTVHQFDKFEKGEKVSLAYHIIFQSFDKTLTEADANASMEKVSTALKAQGFEIR